MTAIASHHLFLVGPASVGKTTVGRALADHFSLPYVDLDAEFNQRIESTTSHIDNKGYESYARTNSALFETLLAETGIPTVFVTPGGFLVHESVPDLVIKHLELLKQYGLTILLLPAKTAEAGVDLVVARQLARPRWNNDSATIERERFLRRFHLYKQHGDIQVFSAEAPQLIVKLIEAELRLHHPDWLKSVGI